MEFPLLGDIRDSELKHFQLLDFLGAERSGVIFSHPGLTLMEMWFRVQGPGSRPGI
jgi:hypothetical protein